MRTALKQRFEGVWSKTYQEVLQDNTVVTTVIWIVHGAFLCLLLVSCLSLSTHLFAKQTQQAQKLVQVDALEILCNTL